MRTRLALVAATMAAGLAVATPAAAQGYYDAPRYDTRAGYGYGYNNRGDVRHLTAQVERMRRDIWQFDRRGMLTGREARKLDRQAEQLQHRIWRMSRQGLHRGEWRSAQAGIANLERAIRHDLRDRGNGRDDRRYRKGHHHRDDRYERRHDRRDRWDD